MEKKIAKIGIIMVLTIALILSSFGALSFGDTFVKEFDIGATNQTTAQAAAAPWDGTTATYEWYTSPSAPNNYRIATASDLKGFSNLVNGTYTNVNGKSEVAISFVDKRIVLTADIVLNETINESSKVWVPIGYADSRKFLGTFDGAGHTVSGIYITRGDYQGLFGYVGSDDVKRSTVKNVGVINSAINGVKYVGGIVAWNYGKVTNCYYTGAVSGTDNNVGGIIGYNKGIVTNCYNTSDMSGLNYVGGIVGQNDALGSVVNCYNHGLVTATKTRAGGTVGGNSGKVTNCYNRGAVVATMSNAGGVVGLDYGASATVKNSYFLKDDSANSALNAVGTATDTKTDTCGYFGVNGVSLTPETGTIIESKNNLFDALTAGVTAYNATDPGKTIPAAEWVEVTNSYPKHKPIVIIPDPTPEPTLGWTYPTSSTISTTPFAVGEGSVGAPFEISTAQELANLSYLVNNANATYSAAGAHFKLTANIELNDTANWEKWETTAPAKKWTPIGNATNQFNGTFDGNGKTVSGIYISGTADNRGLFGAIASTATVQNVGVIKSYIKGRYSVGGVVGRNNGAITNCYNLGSVNGTTEYAGGVVGQNNSGEITNCYNTGDVTGTKYIGGVVGQSDSGSLNNCYNRGEVKGTTSDVGGVAGENTNDGAVINCYNTGAVSGTTTNAGGVVGNQSGNNSATVNCYFLKITDSTNSINKDLNAVGTATIANKVINCSPFGADKKLTTAGIAEQAMVKFDADADLLATLNKGVTAYNKTEPGIATPAMAWAADTEPGGYPKHTTGSVTPPPDPEPTKPFAKGDGSVGSPYEISTAQDLTKLSELINAADAKYSVAGVHYKLTADIKLNGDKTITSTSTDATPWNSIGESGVIPFLGVFDGDSHTVSGIYINNNDQFQGLFGVVGSDTVKTATIKNVGVINSYIEGNGNTGGIVGANNGTITNCYNLGAVTAKGDNVGGVVGGNIGEVINCYNRGDVQQVNETDNNCGGVVGLNVGSVDNCYNLGAVTAKGDNVGGVVGGNIGEVINCYNRGAVKGTTSNVGGVVGNNGGGVINCYNRGDVNGTSNVGGVVGGNLNILENCYNIGAVTGTTSVGGVAGSNSSAVSNCYFLTGKITIGSTVQTSENENAVGAGTDDDTVTNCSPFDTDKKLTTAGDITPNGTNKALVTFEAGADLLATLNLGKNEYNKTEAGKATPAAEWVKGEGGYPKHTAGSVTPPTPPAGGGDSDSEPSISPEDIFWTGIVTDLKLKDEPVVEFNCKYPRMSRRVLLALQEVDKTLNINLNGEKLAITSKQVKPLTFDKATYSVAELKALLEVKPEVTPTPTPTPTEKPTEPTEPTTKKCWLCGACPMFLGICLWIWLAIAVVAVAVVVIIVVKKKKKNDKK